MLVLSADARARESRSALVAVTSALLFVPLDLELFHCQVNLTASRARQPRGGGALSVPGSVGAEAQVFRARAA